MAGARGPAAIVRELEWGVPETAATVQALAAADLELIVAADVCYVDQVRTWTQHNVLATENQLSPTCAYHTQDGVSPSTAAFVATCAALCKPHTQACHWQWVMMRLSQHVQQQVLVCQELRSEAVRHALVQEAAKHFSVVCAQWAV